MIKLTRTNAEYFSYTNGQEYRKVYLCEDGMRKHLGKIPNEIKIYTKNPKSKGAIEVFKTAFPGYLTIKSKLITLGWMTAAFSRDYIKADKFWITIK